MQPDVIRIADARARADRALANLKPSQNGNQPDLGVSLYDFRAYMPMHSYISCPPAKCGRRAASTRAFHPWRWVSTRRAILLSFRPATGWTRHQPVEQMTWAPGEPMLIRDRLIAQGGGWIERKGATVLQPVSPAEH